MRHIETIPTRLRRHLVPLTWFALATFLCGVALPILETHDVVDPDTAAIQLLTVDGGAPRIDKPESSDDAPAHCIFCHWQRAVSGAMVGEVATIASPCAVHSRCCCTAPRLAAFAFSSHSSRAPPLRASL